MKRAAAIATACAFACAPAPLLADHHEARESPIAPPASTSSPPPADAPASSPAAAAAKRVEPFSSHAAGSPIPPPWRLQTYPKIPRHTQFELVADGENTVLHALADHAAASLSHPLSVDPTQHPWLRWRWRPLRAPERSALADKAADDWGARVYVLFEPPPEALGFGERLALGIARALHGSDLPARGLCYVWLPSGTVGQSAPNAYTDRVKMIVVDSAAPGEWRTITRKLADDYRSAFGEPLAPISGIAISADSDTGGGIAETIFGDIEFLDRPLSAGAPQ